MTEYPLYVPDIDVLFQQERGKGVAEHMWGNVLADTGKLCVAVYHKADRLVREHNSDIFIPVTKSNSITVMSRMKQQNLYLDADSFWA